MLFAVFALWICQSAAQQFTTLSSLERELTQLVERAKPAVVSITANVTRQYAIDDGGFWGILGSKKDVRTVQLRNVGSGVIIDLEGHVVTKTSVVEGADEITVSLADGRSYCAEFVGGDYSSGLAVLTIDADDLMIAPLGNSREVRPGAWVTVIGNSLGILPAVSFGLVNGVRKDGLLQLSASITAGNPGSPVFNARGEVIGIVVANVDISGRGVQSFWGLQASGNCIAYPIDMVRDVVQWIVQLKDSGSGWLGINAEYFNDVGETVITGVEEGSPARSAGLLEGDVLVSLGEYDLDHFDHSELARFVRSSNPGEELRVRITRDGAEMEFPVTVGQMPPSIQTHHPVVPIVYPGFEEFPQMEYSVLEQMNVHFIETIRELSKRIKQLELEMQEIKR